eukprot:TRINITY_DN37396_c0_g1_i1.p1 TRINITY_DN37396_c0_g1~~TRINITY_DN37396_c0_g1_i1.p1  ORF type:complete len:427 (-),score=82.87 TRINITY_DN37396_c0_g1_i1:11-1264(-)
MALGTALRVLGLLVLLGLCVKQTESSAPLTPAPESPTAPASNCHESDCGLDTLGLIRSKGYPAEKHQVTTADGYILTMHRIPPKSKGASVVFLQHGLLDASHTWVFNMPDQSLGFILHDHGYDVWLGNSRGNTYSLGHVYGEDYVDTYDYWRFSWDEMVMYDLPAQLEFALEATGQEDLVYIGHSQGTVQGFAGFSSNEALAKRVRLFVAIAPVAYVSGDTNIFFKALADLRFPEILKLFGEKRFLPETKLFETLFPEICRIGPDLCANALCFIVGCDMENFNKTRIPVYVSADPAGSSVQNVIHYAQELRDGTFARYDYGPVKNLLYYGSLHPPKYDLGKVMVDVALFSGGRDVMGDPHDVGRLEDELPKEHLIYTHVDPTYGHLGPMWGVNAHKTTYPPILDLLAGRDPPQVSGV